MLILICHVILTERAEVGAFVEAVVYENGHLGHHEEVRTGEAEHQHISPSSERLPPGEEEREKKRSERWNCSNS